MTPNQQNTSHKTSLHAHVLSMVAGLSVVFPSPRLLMLPVFTRTLLQPSLAGHAATSPSASIVVFRYSSSSTNPFKATPSSQGSSSSSQHLSLHGKSGYACSVTADFAKLDRLQPGVLAFGKACKFGSVYSLIPSHKATWGTAAISSRDTTTRHLDPMLGK